MRETNVSRKDRYYIDVYNLNNGIHQYNFDIEESFFSLFDNNFIEKGEGKAVITIDKSDHLINATFEIDVNIELTCDRTLEKFQYPVARKQLMLFKYGEEEQELDIDVMVITRDTQRINLGQHLLDYIGLAIPYKKLHPRFADEDKEQDELIFQTASDEDVDEDNNAEDPRWEALKKLKNK